YSDAVIRANSWKKIYELLGENDFVDSAESCEKLWSNIWAQYLAFKRKLKGRTGQAGGSRPYFRLADSMKEFDDKMYLERTFSNEDNLGNEEESTPHVTQSITSEDGVLTVVTFDVPDQQRSPTNICSQVSPNESPGFLPPKPRSHEK
ncbi:unnamed protein product, partial [Allacma fusca]